MSELPVEGQTLRLRRMDAATRELSCIVEEKNIVTLFQPLIDPATRDVFGFEALSRGPSDSWLHSPQNLFDAARRCDLRPTLELLCVKLAAARFVETQANGRLFVNVSPDSIYETPRFATQFLHLLDVAGLAAERCVIELTEDGLLDDYAMLRPTLQQLRGAGCEIAIDDLGAGSSGLRIWSELRPDYVKIDRYFISGIDSDAVKLGFVRSIVDLGRTLGCRIIAEGVETPEECRELVELGVDRLQGYLFGRPEVQPVTNTKHFAWMDREITTHTALCAEHLAVYVPPVMPTLRVSELAELFRSGTTRDMLVVVQDGRPLGVVRRDQLFALLSKPLHPEIYNKKRVTAVMEPASVVIEARLRLEQVSRLVTLASGNRWIDEFVITAEGKYQGIGQTMSLLRHITEQQVQAAKHSNPLTQLPGNGPIRDCVKRLLADQCGFVMCYVDLDFFKHYNDVYGYAQGDEVILHLAGLLKKAASNRLDFVGHVGGDDFVLVMRSADWMQRVRHMLASFEVGIRRFYSVEHLSAGHLVAADRDGELRAFPLLSVSVAALHSNTAGCTSAEAAAHLLVEVKQLAKKRAGNSLLLRSNSGICDLLEGHSIEH